MIDDDLQHPRAELARDLGIATRRVQLAADVARALTGAAPLPTLLHACVEAMIRHLDVALARVWTLSDDRTMLALRASAGLYSNLEGPHRRVPIAATQLGRIVTEGTAAQSNAIQTDDATGDREWAVREGMVAFAGHPLRVHGRVIGVLAVISRTPLPPTIIETLASIADIIALGVERRRVEAEQKLESDRKEFLAEATPALATVLDVRKTLSNLARLAVPSLADWCAIEMLADDGSRTEQIAVAHVNPTKVTMAEELGRRYPTPPDAPTGVPNVIRTGVSELYSEIPEELLMAGAIDQEHMRIIRELHLRSAMIVALKVRGRTIGAMTFVIAESDRRYTKDDLAFAEELARRAAIAIDNARLFESEQSARRAADFANRAKDDFLATVSHELRTPLNAMLGWTRMLRSNTLPPEKRDRALETIERNAVTQAQLIEDLLDVSRIISGKLRLDVQSVELSDIVELALDTLRLASEAKHIRVATTLDEHAGPIMGDPHRLQQVVWNLVNNAIKFTPKEGRVHLAVERVESSLKLSVADSGRGIAAEFLPHVFERFRQADNAPTRSYSGLGLGLAISRHIVELHGGTITVESKGENQGATFTVLLPVSPIRDQRRRTASRYASTVDAEVFDVRPELAGLKVLVVDDEADARELVAAVLEKCGSIVRLAGSVSDALEKIRSERPDVIVSDIGLPGEDGYALMRQVRALGGEIPAAALTAYARAEDRRKALDAGFMMHLSKPVEPAELVAVVANLARFTLRR